MLKVLKITGIAFGILFLLGVVSGAAVWTWTGSEIRKTVPIPTHAFVAPTDAASVARGEHLVRALVKCADCHGADLGGAMVIDDPAIGTVAGPNLTRGNGGVGADYTDADFERAIRHGLARDGRRLVIMPSSEYQHISDEDLGAVVAYLRSLPPVDRAFGPPKVGPVARTLYALGQFPLFEADRVLHADGAVPAVPVDSTIAYGKYIGDVGCAGCHGWGYGGGLIPGVPPDWPAAANLTPTGIGHYSFEQFDSILRTGKRPDGTELHILMPIGATKLMTPIEMKAVHLYLSSLPPKPFGTR